MSHGQCGESPSETRQAKAEFDTASRSRFGTWVRTMIALAGCCGVLWWTARAVLREHSPAREAIRAVESGDRSERVDAIHELEVAGLGDGEIAIPPLIAALGDADARVRTAAAGALGQVGTGAIRTGSGPETVWGAITALLGSLKDPEPDVRIAATHALGYIIASGSVAGRIDSKAMIAVAVERLGDRDAEIRHSALGILTAVMPAAGEPPPKELTAALGDESADNRATAVTALAGFKGGLDHWLPSIFRIMESDGEPKVRAACAEAMEHVRPPAITAAAAPALIAALGRPDRRVRAVACTVLAALGPEARAAIPALIATARERPDEPATSEFWHSKYRAIEALGRIAPRTDSAGEVVAALVELLRAEGPSRWNPTVNALEEFGPAAEPAIPELVRALQKSIDRKAPFADGPTVGRALGRIAPGTKSAGAVIAALQGSLRTRPPGPGRGEFVNALGAFGPAAAAAIPDLIRILREPNDADLSGAGYEAAWALGRIAPGSPLSDEAVAVLIGAVQSQSRSTRFAAVGALKPFGVGAVRAIPHLRALLNDADASVRSAAQASLNSLLEASGERK